MEKLRNNRVNRWIAGPTLAIWYLCSIMFVCFSQSLNETGASFAGPAAHGGNVAQASVVHGSGSCYAAVQVDAGSHYCETGSGLGVASDQPQLGIVVWQFAWNLMLDRRESISRAIVDSILKIPALPIFLQICSFLK